MNRRINGVFFDLGWTLECPADEGWTLTKRFFEHVPRERFHALDETLVTDAMKKAMDPLCTDHYMESCEDEFRRFTGYYRSLNEQLSLGLSEEQIVDIAHDHTWNFDNYRVFDSTEETLRILREHGYRVGLISDTWPSTVPQQKEAGLWEYYDFAVLSYALGVMKPNPKMFETALVEIGLPADETVFADDLTGNLDGAEAFGIHGIRSIAPDPSVQESRYPVITRPSDILEIIRRMNGGEL